MTKFDYNTTYKVICSRQLWKRDYLWQTLTTRWLYMTKIQLNMTKCFYWASLLTTVSKTCCIVTETAGTFCILTWWVGAHTYKEYVAKNAPQRHSVLREILHFLATHHHQQWADISQNGNALFPFLETRHWITKCTLHYWFPFLDIWPWKSICEYLNEITTKYCHITTFRKPLTKATQLILISILGNSDQISQ